MKKVFKIIGLTILGLLGLIIIVCLGMYSENPRIFNTRDESLIFFEKYNKHVG